MSRPGVHLIILIHGLYGSPANLLTIDEEVHRAARHSSHSFSSAPSASSSNLSSACASSSDSVSNSTRGAGAGIGAGNVSLSALETDRPTGHAQGDGPDQTDVQSQSRPRPHPQLTGSGMGIQSGEGTSSGLEVVTYSLKSFTGAHTWDGVDVNGYRAFLEVKEEIERLEGDGKEVKGFSIMAYSLGGLVARYLVGLLHSQSPSFFDKYPPVCFSTAATPHLGVLKYQSTTNTIVHTIGRRLFSRSGQQMYCLDRDHDGGRSLLDIMADRDGIFMRALQVFPRIKVVANGCHDLTVPYPTAAISASDPFEEFEATGVSIITDHRHIILSFNHKDGSVLSSPVSSPSASASASPTYSSLTSRSTTRTRSRARIEDNNPLIESTAQAQASHNDGDAEHRTSRTEVSPTSQVEVERQVVLPEYPNREAIMSRRPKLPPILILPYPFTYALFLLLPFILPLWFTILTFVAIYQTYQSRLRHRSHLVSLNDTPIRLPVHTSSSGSSTSFTTADDPDERTPLLPRGLTNGTDLTLPSAVVRDDSMPVSRTETPPLHDPSSSPSPSPLAPIPSLLESTHAQALEDTGREADHNNNGEATAMATGAVKAEDIPADPIPLPGQTPLLLTAAQKRMVKNLNEALPQMERLIAWFPWAFNAHALLIARDKKRFKWHEEGRGVVGAWAEYVVQSPAVVKGQKGSQ